jgi:hypothetical protein
MFIELFMTGLVIWAGMESCWRRHRRVQIRRSKLQARKQFQAWVARTWRPNALICLETDRFDIVWVDRGSRDPNEPSGTARAWAFTEGIPLEPCPGHPNYFLLIPRTPDEAFAIRMRWH